VHCIQALNNQTKEVVSLPGNNRQPSKIDRPWYLLSQKVQMACHTC